MKKVFIVGLLIGYSLNGFSQSSRLSLDINLPIPVGNNFIGKNYNGIFDLGIKYSFIELSNFRLGISGNVGMLDLNSAAKVLMLKPRFNAELGIGKITPYVGIGYSFFNYYVNNNSADLNKKDDGLNLNLGFKFNIISKVYLNFGFDFIKFRAVKGLVDNTYNRNIEIIEIGIGIKI